MRKLIALTLLSAVSVSALATPPDAPNRLFQGGDQIVVGGKTLFRIGRDHPIDRADCLFP